MDPTRADLKVVANWESREYTTDPPRYTPYSVWTLNFRFSAAIPIRLTHVLTVEDGHRWALEDYTPTRSQERWLGLTFRPQDWLSSDDVGVTVSSGASLCVTDSELKRDPRVGVEVGSFETAQTGELTRLADVPRHA